MLPISLNLEKLSVALIGSGSQFERREQILQQYGAKNLATYAGDEEIDFEEFDVVMIVDAPNYEGLYKQAKAANCLTNVEDKKEFCDFYFQAGIKRGDLQISVSTGGKSPGTARLIRECLEECYPEEWDERLEEIAQKRQEWKAGGASFDEVNEQTEEYVKSRKWLCRECKK